jgi:hypothetical protein
MLRLETLCAKDSQFHKDTCSADHRQFLHGVGVQLRLIQEGVVAPLPVWSQGFQGGRMGCAAPQAESKC